MLRTIAGLFAALALFVALAAPAGACPFCTSEAQTFTAEINSMDVVVIAKLIDAPPPPKSAAEEVAKSKFEIVEVIKGKQHLHDAKTIETVYFGEPKIGSKFMITAIDPPKLMWATPLMVSDRARDYLVNIIDLPPEGPERLKFFERYLQDKDEMLARDAYDEFARAPYDVVQSLKDDMRHDKIVEWIQSSDVSASRRRLYFVMLGVCGTEQDVPLLESMLKSDDRKLKGGLDAMIACYLTLEGAKGMPLVEELYLKNKSAEYADTYSAIMALRFHGQNDDIIPRERLLAGMRYILDRPQLADLVVPDFARWKDWSVMEKLVQLFKDADEKSSWVRVPVINYLRSCPQAKAKKYIEELEKIDPESVKRANTFFPATPETPAATQSSSVERPAENVLIAAPTPVVSSGSEIAARSSGPEIASSDSPAGTANPWAAWAVPVVAGAMLLAVQWTILCGAGRAKDA